MPEKVDDCVKSVMADNPDMSESRAYAICNAMENEGQLSDADDAHVAAILRQIEGAAALSDADREAIEASDTYSDKILEEDPCWDDYVMVGTKTVNGREVPNCVPEDEADPANLAAADSRCGEGMVEIAGQCVPVEHSESPPPSALSDPQHLTLKSLDTEPIERVDEGGDNVRYKSLKLLSPGVWADAGSEMATYYPPDGIANLQADYDDAEHDGPPVNIMHDLDMEDFQAHEASVAGHVDPDSLGTDDDGNLFGDVVLDTSTGAGQFADENLQSTLEKEGTVGFGGPSVEIPAEGLQQSHDQQRDMPRVDGGLLSGVALVMDPASKSVSFAREAARRPVALSGSGDNVKVLSRQPTGMRDKLLEGIAENLTLMDVDEIRETLDMFGFDADLDEMTDDEVMDMAEGLHEDLMADLEKGDGDAEMGDYEDDEDDDDTEMEEHDGEDMEDEDDDTEMATDDVEAMQERVQNLASRLEDLEDAVAQAMTADDVDAELSDAKGQELAAADTVDELDKRLSQLEDRPEQSKTLADSGTDEGFEPTYDDAPASSSGW